MNASPNEVALILDAINAVRKEVEDLRGEVDAHRRETAESFDQLNRRTRTLERFRWQLVGAATLATAALGVALRFLTL